jgi:hypothetical protein
MEDGRQPSVPASEADEEQARQDHLPAVPETDLPVRRHIAVLLLCGLFVLAVCNACEVVGR